MFCVEVAPDGGVKSICIRSAEGNSEGFLVINRCPAIQRVMVHTYHTEMSSHSHAPEIGGSSSSTHRGRQNMRLPDFDFHFFASEGETVAYGWPFPFTYPSRPVSTMHNAVLLPATAPLSLHIPSLASTGWSFPFPCSVSAFPNRAASVAVPG